MSEIEGVVVRKPANPLYRKLVLGALAIIVSYLMFKIFPKIEDLIVVLIISVVLTYMFRPIVSSLDRKGIPRPIAILAIFAVVIGVLVIGINFLVPVLIDEIGSLIANIEQIDISGAKNTVVAWMESRVPGLAKMLGLEGAQIQSYADRFTETIAGFLQQSLTILAGAMNVLSLSIVVPFLAFFLLKDGDALSRGMVKRVPNRFFEMTMSLTHRVNTQLGNYIRSVLVESSIVGVLVWGAFEIMGLRFALVLGIVNGLLNMIPFFGPLIAYIPTILVVLLTYSPVGWGLVWMVVVLASAQMIDNVFLKPLLISRSTSVHPATVLIVVLIGGRIAGPIGMFIAVPMYSIIYVVVVDLYDHLKSYRII